MPPKQAYQKYVLGFIVSYISSTQFMYVLTLNPSLRHVTKVEARQMKWVGNKQDMAKTHSQDEQEMCVYANEKLS